MAWPEIRAVSELEEIWLLARVKVGGPNIKARAMRMVKPYETEASIFLMGCPVERKPGKKRIREENLPI